MPLLDEIRKFIRFAFVASILGLVLLLGGVAKDLFGRGAETASAWQAVGGYLSFLTAILLILQNEQLRDDNQKSSEENKAQIIQQLRQYDSLVGAANDQALSLIKASSSLEELANILKSEAELSKPYQLIIVPDSSTPKEISFYNFGSSPVALKNISFNYMSNRNGVQSNIELKDLSDNQKHIDNAILISRGETYKLEISNPPSVAPGSMSQDRTPILSKIMNISFEVLYAGSNSFEGKHESFRDLK